MSDMFAWAAVPASSTTVVAGAGRTGAWVCDEVTTLQTPNLLRGVKPGQVLAEDLAFLCPVHCA